MTPHLADIVGTIAGTLTTLSFIPQVVRIWRTRSAADFSLTMLLAFATGVGLWVVYGLIVAQTPIIVFNGITLLLIAGILGMKIRYGSDVPATVT